MQLSANLGVWIQIKGGGQNHHIFITLFIGRGRRIFKVVEQYGDFRCPSCIDRQTDRVLFYSKNTPQIFIFYVHSRSP